MPMNKREIAKEIFNHPMMKILRESKTVDSSVLNRIIAEEVNASVLKEEPKGSLSNKLGQLLQNITPGPKQEVEKQVEDIINTFLEEIKTEEGLAKYITDWGNANKKRTINNKEVSYEDWKAAYLEAAQNLKVDNLQRTTTALKNFIKQEGENFDIPDEDVTDEETGIVTQLKLDFEDAASAALAPVQAPSEQEVEAVIAELTPPEEKALSDFAREFIEKGGKELLEEEVDIPTKEAAYGFFRGVQQFATGQVSDELTDFERGESFFNKKQSKLAWEIVSDKSFDQNREPFINAISEKPKIAYNYFNAVIFGNPITTGTELDRAVRSLPLQRPADDVEVIDDEFQDLKPAERDQATIKARLEPAKNFFEGDKSFMRVNLLRDQGDLLRNLIVALGQIMTGDFNDGERQALTDFVEVPAEEQPTQLPEEEAPADPEAPLQEQNFSRAPRLQRLMRKLRGNIEAKDIPIGPKGIRITKGEIQSIRDLLVELSKLAKQYEKYATRTHINSSFDGTKLKELFNERLQSVQKHIARIVAIIAKVIEAEFEKLAAQEEVPESGEQLQEQDARARKEKVELVKRTYNELYKLYNNSLKVHLGDDFNFPKAQQTATNMIDIINDSGIVSFFPRISRFDAATGRVITLEDAYKRINELINDLSRTVANIFLNVRDGEIEVPNMQDTIDKLVEISNAIETHYGVKSMVRGQDIQMIDPEAEPSINPEYPEVEVELIDTDGDGIPDTQRQIMGPYSTDPDQDFGLPVPGADFTLNTSQVIKRLARPETGLERSGIKKIIRSFTPEKFQEIISTNELLSEKSDEYYAAFIALMIFMAQEKGRLVKEDAEDTSPAVGDDTLSDEGATLPRSVATKYTRLFNKIQGNNQDVASGELVYQAMANLKQALDNPTLYKKVLQNLKDFAALAFSDKKIIFKLKNEITNSIKRLAKSKTRSNTGTKKPQDGSSAQSQDLDFETGEGTYSTGQMGTGKPTDFSPDPSKRATPGERKTFSGPTGYTGSAFEKTPPRRLRGSRPLGGKKPKRPSRDFIDSKEAEDFFSRKLQEQLIKKLIPIVESILKD